MNRLIWFFDCSANSKETLSKHIYSRQDEKLNSNLGIDLRKTIILDKSIQYISKHLYNFYNYYCIISYIEKTLMLCN